MKLILQAVRSLMARLELLISGNAAAIAKLGDRAEDTAAELQELQTTVEGNSENIRALQGSVYHNYILLDAPTLFESKADGLCDIIVSVIADRDIRLNRILKRDSITLHEAEIRLNSQKNDDFYMGKSDYVIKNNGSLSELENNTMDVVNSIKEQSDEEK